MHTIRLAVHSHPFVAIRREQANLIDVRVERGQSRIVPLEACRSHLQQLGIPGLVSGKHIYQSPAVGEVEQFRRKLVKKPPNPLGTDRHFLIQVAQRFVLECLQGEVDADGPSQCGGDHSGHKKCSVYPA